MGGRQPVIGRNARKFYMELYTADSVIPVMHGDSAILDMHGPDLLPTLSHVDHRLLID